jgi:hypothetical protein
MTILRFRQIFIDCAFSFLHCLNYLTRADGSFDTLHFSGIKEGKEFPFLIAID